MNTWAALLVVVVVGVMSPVQGRSALSQMLDMVGEIQNTDFGTVNIPEYSESKTNKALENMQKLFTMTREIANLVAEQENPLQPISPEQLKQIELMEKVIPQSIKIAADLASNTADDPMLEPALPDMTNSATP